MSGNVKRLYRSRGERMLGGVCGGLAEYFNMDPTIVRLIMVLAAFAGGPGLVAYVILWVIIPEAPLSTTSVFDGLTESRDVKRPASPDREV